MEDDIYDVSSLVFYGLLFEKNYTVYLTFYNTPLAYFLCMIKFIKAL